ncbi:MAG TPA: hypothetical protein PJ997_00955 [Candidatus Paceibacterota bacterium]|nr:hypothetical protein [Candidatus Paceibacterota bacterium]HMP18891.1 hypothetical protein [Candidatus Paceibacterota bacterium]HMP85052.1 hypothetical protein [Candidatus Paceibacterota bacterium]
MDKKIVIISVLLTAIVLIYGVFWFNKKQNQDFVILSDSQIEQLAENTILYYGDGCPACAQLEEIIKERDIRNQISIIEKEIYKNKNNSSELMSVSQYCGIDPAVVGIPFLFDEGECFVGVPDVLARLDLKISKTEEIILE